MSNRLAVYAADEIAIIIGAIPIEDGLPKGTFLKITVPEQYGSVGGTDGHVARFRMKNRIYRAELTLLQTSKHHAELSALHALDTATSNGAGIGAFLCSDAQGATLFASEFAWVVKAPDPEFGEEVKEYSPWLIDFVADPSSAIVGGN